MPIIYNDQIKKSISLPIIREERHQQKPIFTIKQRQFLKSLGYIVNDGNAGHTRTCTKRSVYY